MQLHAITCIFENNPATILTPVTGVRTAPGRHQDAAMACSRPGSLTGVRQAEWRAARSHESRTVTPGTASRGGPADETSAKASEAQTSPGMPRVTTGTADGSKEPRLRVTPPPAAGPRTGVDDSARRTD